ncbi:uncharacterized protein LOC6040695 isoform X2 [Culex quinquefasciatus]|uniref:uncharacterized protein LOC6040695 isoform X2 n=1 Tax=Culex quinquefasciatus TaxID=7176 RepID=UPI0018E3C260|nr:uncharacterized protein LOC6040695 isoform X2 [Culex quinquefasciatus]
MLFKKDKPFPMMETTVRLCKFIGLWHDTDLGKVCWQAKFTLASLTFWYIVPEICFVTRQDRELTIRLKGMIEILAMSIFVVRIGAHVLHRGTLQRCFWDVQETLGQFVDSGHVEVQKMLEHLVSSASFITRSYTTALLCNASLYGDIPALIAIGQYLMGADIETFPPTILEADYVLFEHQSNILVWIPVLLVSIATQYSMLTSLAANECLNWNLLHHVSCLFKMVKFEISHLGECSTSDEFKKRLVKIVTVHDAAYRVQPFRRQSINVAGPSERLRSKNC